MPGPQCHPHRLEVVLLLVCVLAVSTARAQTPAASAPSRAASDSSSGAAISSVSAGADSASRAPSRSTSRTSPRSTSRSSRESSPSSAPDSMSGAAADSASTARADSLLKATLRAPVPLPSPRGTGVRDTVTLLPPVEVGGERPAEHQTGTTTHVERRDLVRFLPLVTTDALVTVPGVDLVKTGPWASRLSLRGLSGDRVLVLVDGVRLNSVRGHGGQPSIVALDRLDEVELTPGATSAQYGSDALGGVINLVTHRPL